MSAAILQPALVDTDTLHLVARGTDPGVRARARAYLAIHGQLTISALAAYEWVAGHVRVGREHGFARLAELCEQLPVDAEVSELAGELVGCVEAQGLRSGALDPVIAATAIVHDRVLVTRDRRSFEALRGAAQTLGRELELSDWTG
ncbi:tRNA(fMet)-specific endonuclease VapC [Enhygromyxa salina]|uniref:Ribonuclease VapC n=1 Tax=Enhygromyxa salina TaxID=215803 RepID=A0A2S9XDL3_9BACT|nr:PIN domain-containing protein [Enhygromyxa salina]PRP90958.1 tRNA(fMet)-specific endonuclease VapC [Enhygromyxa salina]